MSEDVPEAAVSPRSRHHFRICIPNDLALVKPLRDLISSLCRLDGFDEEKTQEIADLRLEFGLPVDFYPFFLALQKRSVETRAAYEQRLEIIENMHERPSVRDLVDHVDYVVNRIGIDHVGLSSDFYNYSFSLDGWRDASETRNVTLELARRGYSVEEIGKIWSRNALRVWSEVEEVAAQLQR